MTIAKNLSFMLLLAASVAGVSCSNSNDEADEPIQDPTEFVDDQGEGLTSEQEKTYHAGVNGFTFNLLRQYDAKLPTKGIVCSPLSVATVLAMMNDGAAGQTREELLQVLGFSGSKSRSVNEYFQKMLHPTANGETVLRTANALFVKEGNAFKPQFSADMHDYYDALTETLDFGSRQSVDYINDWCKEHTEGLIPHIVDQLSPDILSVLLNAIYFKGRWELPFREDFTIPGAFTAGDGTQREVQMMHHGYYFDYVETDQLQALRLKYTDKDYNMLLLLPKAGATTSDIISQLTEESWSALNSQLKGAGRLVTVTVPRFSVETQGETASLVSMLGNMGLHSMFSQETAQFPNILTSTGVYVADIIHKATINVNEAGTEAAAVTVEMAAGAPDPWTVPVIFTADHPFVYVISSQKTGLVYFIGTYQG